MTSDEIQKVFTKIAETSGNSKQGILANYPSAMEYLKAAYNPYIRYYVTSKSIGFVPSLEPGVFSSKTWRVLDKLSTRELSGNLAKEVVRHTLRQLSPWSQDLFCGILNKDLRIGMGTKTINKVFDSLVPTHDVMLAQLFNTKRVQFPCYASVKIDGVRGTKCRGKFYSRNGHEYSGLDHLIKEFKSSNDLLTEFDGELVIPKLSFQRSSGLIRSNQNNPEANFYIFEVRNLDLSFIHRLSRIKRTADTCPHVKLVPHKVIHSMQELQAYYQLCRSKGFEGVVVKPLDYRYKGSRSYDWMKMKPLESLDLRVVSTYGGEGKYAGMLGGVRVDFNDNHDNGVGSGFSDAERALYWESPELIMNKVIEIECTEFTDNGNIRHSRFKGIREDKS